MAPTPTVTRLPRRCEYHLAQCYALCAAAQLTSAYRDLGTKLHLLLPRWVCCPLGCRGVKAHNLFRHRCQKFVQGEWAQLQREAPAPLTDSQRQALQAERNHRRGYTADDQLEASVRKMTQGRPSQSLAILMSHGVNPGRMMLDLHFEPPVVDPHELSDAEHGRYHYLRQQAPTPAFEAALRAELEKRLPKLRRGVGPGPPEESNKDGRRFVTPPPSSCNKKSGQSRMAHGCLRV
jgi:hypothetical protein